MDPEGIWEPRDATRWVRGRERIKIQIIGFLMQSPIFLGFIITVFSLSRCSWLTGKKQADIKKVGFFTHLQMIF